MKLIKRNIDAIEKPEKDLYLFDDDLAGFGLRVYPTGRKVFIAQYRVGGGRGSRQRRYTLGVFGKITADEARTKAKDVLARAHLGEDTAEERDKVRRSQTVAQLIDAWSVDGALNNRRTGVRRKLQNSLRMEPTIAAPAASKAITPTTSAAVARDWPGTPPCVARLAIAC